MQDSAISGWLKSLCVYKKQDIRESVMEAIGRNILKRAHPWKAPGPDGITAIW